MSRTHMAQSCTPPKSAYHTVYIYNILVDCLECRRTKKYTTKFELKIQHTSARQHPRIHGRAFHGIVVMYNVERHSWGIIAITITITLNAIDQN